MSRVQKLRRNREKVASGKSEDFAFVSEGCAHNLRLAAGCLQSLVDGGHGLHARILEAAVGGFVPAGAFGGLEPVVNAADKGTDEGC